MESMVRIKNGATVGQDFSVFQWENDGTIFEAKDRLVGERKQCIADGYGSQLDYESYGNGALYAKPSDLIFLSGINDRAGLAKPETFKQLYDDAMRTPLFWVETILLEIDCYVDECEKKIGDINGGKCQFARIDGALFVKNKLMELEKRIVETSATEE